MKPFRVSIDYLDWAHGPGAEDGQPLATRIIEAPGYQMKFKLFTDPQLVAEIADVAELYVGGPDNDLRAANVFKRAKQWLVDNGHANWRELLRAAHSQCER